MQSESNCLDFSGSPNAPLRQGDGFHEQRCYRDIKSVSDRDHRGDRASRPRFKALDGTRLDPYPFRERGLCKTAIEAQRPYVGAQVLEGLANTPVHKARVARRHRG